MSEAITPAAAAAVPAGVLPSRDGRRTIACPQVAAGELRCFKVHNPDPEADWDFLFMLIDQRVGPISIETVLIPLAGGGYRRFRTRIGTSVVQTVRSFEKFEAKSDDFGIVRIDRVEARRSFVEIRAQVFRGSTDVRDFDADGRPVSEPSTTDHPLWPELPGDGEAADAPRQLDAAGEAPLDDRGAVIHFASSAATEDGDFEVWDGEVSPVDSSAALDAAVRPGVRIEVLQRLGVPSAIVNDYFHVDEAGHLRRLYGDRCVQETKIRIVERIREESDSGFFRSRHKLTVVRNMLRVDELQWEDT